MNLQLSYFKEINETQIQTLYIQSAILTKINKTSVVRDEKNPHRRI